MTSGIETEARERSTAASIGTRVAMDDVERYVLERGKPVPSKHHSIVQVRIGSIFLRDGRYDVFSELSLDLQGWQSVPDISVYLAEPPDWLHDEVRVSKPPLLAVEIVSPSQTMPETIDKAEEYLVHGVESCWIVQPHLRLVSIFTKGEQPVTYTSGTLTDPATGITLSLDEVFR